MATGPIDPTKKTALLNVIKANDCNAAQYINQKLVNWEDGPKIMVEFSKTFDCNPSYLDDILPIFTDSELTTQGIYYEKSGATITNPVFVVKSTDVDITIDAGGRVEELDIVNGSQVNSIVISANTTVGVLSISGNSITALLDVQVGSYVEAVIIKACVGGTAELSSIADGNQSRIGDIIAESPAVFGGFTCEFSTI